MKMNIEKFTFIIDYYEDRDLNLNILFYQTLYPYAEMEVNLPINHIMWFDDTLYLCHYSCFRNAKTINIKMYKDIIKSFGLEKIDKIAILYNNIEYEIKKLFKNINPSVKKFYLMIEDEEFKKPKLKRMLNYL